jgi:hypothetical protein
MPEPLQQQTRQHQSPPPPAQGMRQAIFTLDEGDVVLSFPSNLSAEGYKDLEEYLQIFLRKAKRRANSPAEEA